MSRPLKSRINHKMIEVKFLTYEKIKLDKIKLDLWIKIGNIMRDQLWDQVSRQICGRIIKRQIDEIGKTGKKK